MGIENEGIENVGGKEGVQSEKEIEDKKNFREEEEVREEELGDLGKEEEMSNELKKELEKAREELRDFFWTKRLRELKFEYGVLQINYKHEMFRLTYLSESSDIYEIIREKVKKIREEMIENKREQVKAKEEIQKKKDELRERIKKKR